MPGWQWQLSETHEKGTSMPRAIFRFAVCILLLSPLMVSAGEKFDGEWTTKLTCPPKGSTEGYTWTIPSTIQNNTFHGERGTAGEPGYFSLDGGIKQDGSAKLTASGIVASRKYARGILAHSGEEYSYDVKAQFKENEGSGARNEGLGIVGRPCTFEFTRKAAPAAAGN
jgi:hypothetical protein